MSTIDDEGSIRSYVEDFECLMEGIAHFTQLEQRIALESNIEAADSTTKRNGLVRV
jgi:hypothetical protein